MSLRRFDLPLRQGAASRFLPWTIGGLLYLAAVALAVAAIADEALRLYGLRAELVTVTLPSVQDAGHGEENVTQAVDILRRTPGVRSVVPVPPEELEALVEPWLDDFKSGMDLPLPRLIDVIIDPHAKPDLAALQERLAEVVEGARVGVEALSRDRAERLAAFLRAWGSGAGIVALVGTLALVALIIAERREKVPRDCGELHSAGQKVVARSRVPVRASGQRRSRDLVQPGHEAPVHGGCADQVAPLGEPYAEAGGPAEGILSRCRLFADA